MRDGRWAAGWLAVAGLGVVVGSFLTGDMCLHVPCERAGTVIHTIWQRSGIEIGPGVLTAFCGLLLTLLGIDGTRRDGRLPFKREILALGWLAALIPVVYVIGAHGSRQFALTEPSYGLYLVVVGGALAVLAAARSPDPEPETRAWALSRRHALAMLVCGVAIWLLAMSGSLPVRREPLTLVVVLIALGLALWPRPLTAAGFRPIAVAAGLTLYGIVAFSIVLLREQPLTLLELVPFVPIAALAAGRIARGLPRLQPPLISPRSAHRLSRTASAGRSAVVVLVGGVLLTVAALLVLLTRLLGSQDGPGWLARWGVVSPGVIVVVLLIAAGVAMLGYMAWQLRRLTQGRFGS